MERSSEDSDRQTPEHGERLRINTIVIPADEQQLIRLAEIEPANLGEYQQLVGGLIQPVYLEQPQASMYMNEEGKIQGLPLNRRATLLLWMHRRAFRYEDAVAGDAFIVGPADGKGHDTDVPEEFVAMLFEAQRFHLEVRGPRAPHWRRERGGFKNWVDAYSSALRVAQHGDLINDARVVAED